MRNTRHQSRQASQETTFGGVGGDQIELLPQTQSPKIAEQQQIGRIDRPKPERWPDKARAGFEETAVCFRIKAENPDLIAALDECPSDRQDDRACSSPRPPAEELKDFHLASLHRLVRSGV